MVQHFLDYSEYERLKAIEKEHGELKQKSKEEAGTHHQREQSGSGEISTASLQREVIARENGTSSQDILENPTAPVIFDSDPIPSTSRSNVEAEPKKEQKKCEQKKAPKKVTEVAEQKWWFLD